MHHEVLSAMVEAADSLILPRFRALAPDQVWEKSPDEFVTAADQESEAFITARLSAILDIPVVGEEAVASDTALVQAIRTADRVWLLDPLDGTHNFAHGKPDFAVMVALVEHGMATASWIWQPVNRVSYVAHRGSGAERNGVALRRPPAPTDPGDLVGAVMQFYAPPDAPAVDGTRFREVLPGRRCAGIEYPLLAEGAEDFVWFHRTLPWDHAPGSLLLEEIGGTVRRPDGTPYRPDQDGTGLLVAADEATWQTVRDLIVG